MDLCSYVPPLGENILISVEPFPVDDLVPMEDGIEWVVKILKNHRSGEPSRMQAKHLKGWLAGVRKKDDEEAAA